MPYRKLLSDASKKKVRLFVEIQVFFVSALNPQLFGPMLCRPETTRNIRILKNERRRPVRLKVRIAYMDKKKDVLTTGEVAKICNVAPRTVTKWFDSGQLRGYRIPGSRDRRIPTGELIRFMKAHNMPTDAIEKGQMRVLIIDADAETSRQFAETLQTKGSFEVCCANNSFDAGLLAEKFRPQIILINLMNGQINAQQLCTHVRGQQELQDTKVIAVAAGLNGNESAALKKRGFDAVLTDANNADQAVKLIQECHAVFS